MYAWKVNGADMGTGNTLTYIPSNGEIVSVIMTGNAACATALTAMNALTMTVMPYKMPSATAVANPGNSVCQGTEVVFTATTALEGSKPNYYWLKNSQYVGTGTTYKYTPTSANNGDVIVFMLKSSYQCTLADTVFSDPIVMNVDAALMPDFVLGNHLGPKIGVGQVDTFFATIKNGTGATMTYQWKVQGTPVPGANSPMYVDYNVFNADVVSVDVTRIGACGSQTLSKELKVNLSDVGVHQVATTGTDVVVVPNPYKGEFTIKGSLGTTLDAAVSLEITDMLGQMVYKSNVMTQGGNINERIQLNKNIANGMYILNLRSEAGNNVFHIVVEQ